MSGSHLTSFVLSQFFGLYMLIVALLMFYRAPKYRKMVLSMNPESSTILFAALIGLMLGLFLVGMHNVWVIEPAVLVTMICWLILVLSLLWLVTPERMLGWTKKLCSGSGYHVLASFMVLLGLMLWARGVYIYVKPHQGFLFMSS